MARIAVIPGDGIGNEVIPEGLRVLRHLDGKHGLGLTFEHFDLGAERYLRDGTTMPPEVMARFRDEFDAILLGALGDPRVPSNVHAKDILLGSRFQLDLYVNLRPVRLLDARYCPLKGKGPDEVDMVVFRENTEGLYTGIGGQFKRGTEDEVAIEQEINTRKGVERIIRAAFEYARAQKRRSVCMSDKANAMRHGHDLWQRVFKLVAAEYPDIPSFHLYVDVLAMEMVRAPERLDVIVTTNLFGDIVTDLGAALQGGLGLAGSGNIHPGKVSLFEPVHGSAPDIAGQGIANPLATMLACGMMLTHLGHPELEAQIQDAVRGNLADGQVTRELGGSMSTKDVTDALISRL
ncbi:MAG: 3-isopropylmalate dehydrogenase [Alphaproteobacteria bacterium]|nr:3-isopropylmalate dehydrogenase [Alphaproteobacteria bacterium]MCB9695585.1 3-isopropylmalate dehydrogenase [Alphaproteobacteria bacterium]